MPVIPIRPSRILELDPEPYRPTNVLVPTSRSQVSAIETFLLVALVRKVKPDIIFEFGTSFGYTTKNLALAAGPNATIHTLDLSPHEYDRLAGGMTPADRKAALAHFENPGLSYVQDSENIITHLMDSREFEPEGLEGKVSFIFIDGGHDFDTVSSDTKKAFQMLKHDGPACIVWHNYGVARFPDVAALVQQNAAKRKMYWVEGTQMVVAFWGLDETDNLES